ncbi:hypothetical protein H6P81_008799 [Aristolochia fimbriata]|uniref:Uncharacterized protein n=1 Tax=Aristolochia fimbriata TaxID=158543 RepID=A0AAV7EJQ9_ARIFI|nr:hypothetical protein H6P81_008799 [Aristolochia fimbriata]
MSRMPRCNWRNIRGRGGWRGPRTADGISKGGQRVNRRQKEQTSRDVCFRGRKRRRRRNGNGNGNSPPHDGAFRTLSLYLTSAAARSIQFQTRRPAQPAVSNRESWDSQLGSIGTIRGVCCDVFLWRSTFFAYEYGYLPQRLQNHGSRTTNCHLIHPSPSQTISALSSSRRNVPAGHLLQVAARGSNRFAYALLPSPRPLETETCESCDSLTLSLSLSLVARSTANIEGGESEKEKEVGAGAKGIAMESDSTKHAPIASTATALPTLLCRAALPALQPLFRSFFLVFLTSAYDTRRFRSAGARVGTRLFQCPLLTWPFTLPTRVCGNASVCRLVNLKRKRGGVESSRVETRESGVDQLLGVVVREGLGKTARGSLSEPILPKEVCEKSKEDSFAERAWIFCREFSEADAKIDVTALRLGFYERFLVGFPFFALIQKITLLYIIELSILTNSIQSSSFDSSEIQRSPQILHKAAGNYHNTGGVCSYSSKA